MHEFNIYNFVSGNYILNYLATQPKLPNFVIQALVTLFARISKFGWFDIDKDEYVFRNVVSDVTKFLQVGYYFKVYLKIFFFFFLFQNSFI